MTSTIVVKQSGIDNFEWLQFDSSQLNASASPLMVGDGERLHEQSANADNVIVLADAKLVTIRQVEFEDHERKLLRQTLPYALEDDCVEDVDDLHFALGPVQNNTAPLAIMNRKALQKGIADFEQEGVEIKQLVSELSLIPLVDNGWSILVNDECWLVRSGQYQGFSLDLSTITLGLQLLLDESEAPPGKINIYCLAEQQAAVLNQLPELLRGIVDWQAGDYWQVIAVGLQQVSGDAKSINLLQGDFARSLPWLKWWRLWRVAAILFLSAGIFQLITTYTEMKVLDSKNLALRTAIEGSYRSVIPKGAVMDAERQLRRKVNALKGSGGEGFVSLLEKIAPVLVAIKGMTVQNLNYSEKQSEIRLTVMAAGFNDVETVRTNLEKLGLNAELTGSSADGDKTRARLRIRG